VIIYDLTLCIINDTIQSYMIYIYQIKGVILHKVDPNLFIQKIIEDGTLHRFVFMGMLSTKNLPIDIQSLMAEAVSIKCTTCHHLYTLTLNDFLLRKKECVCCANKIHNITPMQNKHLLVSQYLSYFKRLSCEKNS